MLSSIWIALVSEASGLGPLLRLQLRQAQYGVRFRIFRIQLDRLLQMRNGARKIVRGHGLLAGVKLFPSFGRYAGDACIQLWPEVWPEASCREALSG